MPRPRLVALHRAACHRTISLKERRFAFECRVLTTQLNSVADHVDGTLPANEVMGLAMSIPETSYMLAAGERGAARLGLLDNVFGPATREFLLACGLKRGWRVAEVGCGVGLVSLWMAKLGASVSAVDSKAAQIETARKYAREQDISNIDFRVADAYQTQLPREEFDLVYARFLLCHLPDPVRALREMCALVKPGGILACEDFDQQSVASEPPSQAYNRLNEISNDLDKVYGVNSWDIGSRLARLFVAAGLAAPQVKVRRNAFRRGGEKRLWELTLEEARPAIIEHRIAKSEELDKLCADLRRIADDESVLVIAARVTQVCARK